MKIQFRILLICMLTSAEALSQKPVWDIGLYSFFDNTEFGHSAVRIPQTMAGVRFAPELGMQWDSVHSVKIGVNMLHEFGSNTVVNDLYPSAYYQYNRKPFRFLMGAFPRKFALDSYPRIFFQDSIGYYRPNITGLLWEYSQKKFLFNVWLDWTSRQSHEMHEAFFMGFSGKYKTGILYLQQFTYMFHFAGTMNPLIDEALHDNGLFLSSAGIDLSGKTFLDRLNINGGWVVGLDRARSEETGWIVQNGFLSELIIEYKRFGLFNTFYSGSSQMHYYNDHDNELYWGDPFFRTNKYNRSDFYIDFIKTSAVSTRLTYSLHLTENRIYHEQALKVIVNLNSPDSNP